MREALPFKNYKPLRVGDWVYAYRKGKWNIATIEDIEDHRMKVFYFERQYWFNHHSVFKREVAQHYPNANIFAISVLSI